MNIRVALIVALAALLSCTTQARAAHPKAAVQDFFDEQSASNLSVVAKPLVFARERSDVAAFARDYATLVAVEVDLSGHDNEYLLLYRWSTVDPRMSPPPRADQGELQIAADGRLIDLRPLDALPFSLTRRDRLHVPDHGDIMAHAYPIDVATLRFIATSSELIVRMPQERLDLPFKLWEDGRSALAEFAGP